ncbi:MAG: flavodoxin-dependent (E)-4-hydroxy-3-methylbut-2-enyl-diphosphate synthase, partial [Clostridia bacterium]|nr:flavodoxin-dependent (E)-4-hydroxy-3-methylbut-2-enyl-diphosphate synthase [Clostridia bacterium]
MTTRRSSRAVRVGGLTIGGSSPITVQSMTNTDPRDHEATLRQVRALVDAGCDIVRLAVPDAGAAAIFSYLKEQGVKVPLVADIHFDHKLALEAVAAGADKIRINPGNVGSREKVAEVVRACRASGVPIRIGVNGGSLEKSLLAKYGAPTAEAVAESALGHARILEEMGCEDLVISIKSSDVLLCAEAYRLVSEQTDHPLHVGITEAGTVFR